MPADRPLIGPQVHEVMLSQLRAAGLRPGDAVAPGPPAAREEPQVHSAGQT